MNCKLLLPRCSRALLNICISGKLHNVARAIVDEDSDKTYPKEGIKFEKKDVMMSEKGVVLGHGLRILKQASRTDPSELYLFLYQFAKYAGILILFYFLVHRVLWLSVPRRATPSH